MQIDFHHAVTYVTARVAGFPHEEADIIAYAAQYVDDATSSGAVVFENKALYTRISSAHKTTDVENLNDVENHVVWLPFNLPKVPLSINWFANPIANQPRICWMLRLLSLINPMACID